MTKRIIALLLIIILPASAVSCGVSANSSGTAAVANGEYDGAISIICEQMGLERGDAEELYALILDSGLTDELKYIRKWDDHDTGASYYRFRTNSGKRDVYLDGGEVVLIVDGDIVYYDADAVTDAPSTELPDTTELPPVRDDTDAADDPDTIADIEPPVEPIDTETPDTSTEPTETEPPGTEQAPDTTPPHTSSTRTYVLNTNSKKFHLPTCSSVKQIKESNREEYTGDRETLIEQGYSPCKRCNP